MSKITLNFDGTTIQSAELPFPSLGETSTTAYRGDRGKTAYDHSQNSSVHVTAAEKSKIAQIPTIATVTNAIPVGQKTLTLSYTGTYMSSYLKDSSNNRVEAEQQINSNNVVFTLQDNATSAITCVVVYCQGSVEDGNNEVF